MKRLTYILNKCVTGIMYAITDVINFILRIFGFVLIRPFPVAKRKRLINVNKLSFVQLSSFELAAHEIITKNINGAIAELGVHKGMTAIELNALFPDRTLYLFDTFEGFDERDRQVDVKNAYSPADLDFSDTNISYVSKRLPFPKSVIFKKGYFPETAKGIDEEFAFVHLDPDLYKPIYDGLKFFYPRLARGGYIFVHDYNNDYFSGVKKAVRQFSEEENVPYFPLTDSTGSAVFCK